MNDELKVYHHEKLGDLRALLENGVPMFLAVDAAKALKYSNPQKAIRDHVDEEDKQTEQFVLSGQRRDVVMINESGLYSLILSSKLPAAKAFKHWVTSEVLPSIRKTGSYSVPKSPWKVVTDALSVAQNQLAIYKDQLDQARAESADTYKLYKEQKAENTKLLPDASYTQDVLKAKNTWNTNVIAKEFGLCAKTLNKKLEALGIQYKQHGVWLLSSEYQDKGYVKTKTYPFVNSKGETCSRLQTEWTEEGRKFLHFLHDKKKF